MLNLSKSLIQKIENEDCVLSDTTADIIADSINDTKLHDKFIELINKL